MLLMAVTAMIDSSVEDVKEQQAALHQQQVTNAANKYITAKYAELVKDTIAVGTVTPVTLAQLKTDGFLSNSFSNTNAFNQTPCVLVRKSSSSTVDALVATYGGQAIPERDIPLVGMYAGQGGGYISTEAPGTARGASWNLVTNNYRGVACGGTTVLDGSSTNDGGHLVSGLFYDGPGQLSTDFLYRSAVPGKPELNQMNTPLAMSSSALVNLGDACGSEVALGVDKATRDFLVCAKNGLWSIPSPWKEPVQNYSDLATKAGSVAGDVRMVNGLKRAFTYDGSNWVALAVDQNNNFQVPGTVTANYVTLNQVAVHNAPCSPDGMMARDATGLTLSCQNGSWRSPLDVRLNSIVYFNQLTLHGTDGPQDFWIDMKSLPGGRPLYFVGSFTCHATGNTPAYVYGDMHEDPFWISSIGTCLSQLDYSGNGVKNTMNSAFNKIPENITTIHLRIEPGATADDSATLLFIIYDTY